MKMKLLACCLQVLCIFLLCSGARAEGVGVVITVKEPATIEREDFSFTPEPGGNIHLGDVIRTGPEGGVKILFDSDVVLCVAEETVLAITKHKYDAEELRGESILDLLKGLVRSIIVQSNRDSSYIIRTPNAAAGARGTDFLVRYAPESRLTRVYVWRGKVEVESLLEGVTGAVLLDPGYWTEVRGEGAPAQPRVLTPEASDELKRKTFLPQLVRMDRPIILPAASGGALAGGEAGVPSSTTGSLWKDTGRRDFVYPISVAPRASVPVPGRNPAGGGNNPSAIPSSGGGAMESKASPSSPLLSTP